MEIIRVITGYLEENCYILKKDGSAIIIDPGDEENKIISAIGNSNVVGVLITHYHFDHIGALDAICKKYNVETFEPKLGKHKIENFSFEIIDTPGHTSDSVTYYFKDENVMFTGDFLFKESIGRTDFENSNHSDMLKSIDKIKKYDKNIEIYPGHGDRTTIGHEINYNMFFM